MPGEPVLAVTTPVGTTASEPGVVNTLTLYTDALAASTPLLAPVVGIEVGAAQGSNPPIDTLTAPLLYETRAKGCIIGVTGGVFSQGLPITGSSLFRRPFRIRKPFVQASRF